MKLIIIILLIYTRHRNDIFCQARIKMQLCAEVNDREWGQCNESERETSASVSLPLTTLPSTLDFTFRFKYI